MPEWGLLLQEAEKKVKPEEPTLPPAVYMCEHKGLAEIYLLTAEARIAFLRGKYKVRHSLREDMKWRQVLVPLSCFKLLDRHLENAVQIIRRFTMKHLTKQSVSKIWAQQKLRSRDRVLLCRQCLDWGLFFKQEAIKKLQAAVEIEDNFAYMEPPRVYQPIRQCLGYVLLESDEVEAAEKVCWHYLSSKLHFKVVQSSSCPRIWENRLCQGKSTGKRWGGGPKSCCILWSVYFKTADPTSAWEKYCRWHCLQWMSRCRCIELIWLSTLTMGGRCMVYQRLCIDRRSLRRSNSISRSMRQCGSLLTARLIAAALSSPPIGWLMVFRIVSPLLAWWLARLPFDLNYWWRYRA